MSRGPQTLLVDTFWAVTRPNRLPNLALLVTAVLFRLRELVSSEHVTTEDWVGVWVPMDK